jgi:hypothetical protein
MAPCRLARLGGVEVGHDLDGVVIHAFALSKKVGDESTLKTFSRSDLCPPAIAD